MRVHITLSIKGTESKKSGPKPLIWQNFSRNFSQLSQVKPFFCPYNQFLGTYWPPMIYKPQRTHLPPPLILCTLIICSKVWSNSIKIQILVSKLMESSPLMTGWADFTIFPCLCHFLLNNMKSNQSHKPYHIPPDTCAPWGPILGVGSPWSL